MFRLADDIAVTAESKQDQIVLSTLNKEMEADNNMKIN